MYKRRQGFQQVGFYWIVSTQWMCSATQDYCTVYRMQRGNPTTSVTKKVDLRGYGTVWYHHMGIANIPSLNNVSKKYQVTYDSDDKDDQGLVVHKEYGSKGIFRPSKKVLYYSNAAHDVRTILVHTVDSNKSKYSVRQYSLAKKACDTQDIIGRPSTKDFILHVEGNMIPKCKITRQDILRAEDIFGPNLDL